VTDDLDRARLVVLVHEVRSPVAALSAVAEAVRDHGVNRTMRPEFVRLALSACDAIQRVVMDVAVASVRFERLDCRWLVHETAGSFALRGEAVTAEVADHGLLVLGDPVRLRQALDNLITNALTHSGVASPVLVRAIDSDGRISIVVSDAGAGIPREELARIFELGTRLSTSTPGAGLGLALTRAIIDAHGGRLEVDSAPGAGTTLTISLPALFSQPAT
jgi:two-component system sensor histidine kinase BaeS